MYIGIDVSKKTLDIYISPEKAFQQIPNNQESIKGFCRKLGRQHQEIKMIVCEATGGYERDLVNLLREAKLPIHIAHPNKIRYFANGVAPI